MTALVLNTTTPTQVPAPIPRKRVALLLTLVAVFGLVLVALGRIGEIKSAGVETVWRRDRALMAGTGCAICGSAARWQIARPGATARSAGSHRLGLRCDSHKDSESIHVESGRLTWRFLGWVGLGISLLPIVAVALAWSTVTQALDELAAPARPARVRSRRLCACIWVGTAIYVGAMDFTHAYSTLPVWLVLGGMLCLWLYELLAGGEYVRCRDCSWKGNMDDLEHSRGACPWCAAASFRVQELVRTTRTGTRTVYHFRLHSNIGHDQLVTLESSGRLWKEARAPWVNPRSVPGAPAPSERVEPATTGSETTEFSTPA